MSANVVDAAPAADRLSANARVFQGLLEGVSAAQARWKPAPAQWSVLEVVGHLADEEAEDFRRRVELTLADPEMAWPPIDPQGWPLSRGYNERELATALARFLEERARSVAWLRSLQDADWTRAHAHPLAALRAGDLLASWLDHDLIHIRQLTRLHHQWLVQQAAPYSTEYAGGF